MAAALPKVFIVMRHSERLDQLPEFDNADWLDQNTRPFDTPISDFQLPRSQADKLRAFEIECVVSSPFRRCLQTAGEVCRTLGITELSCVFFLDWIALLYHHLHCLCQRQYQ